VNTQNFDKWIEIEDGELVTLGQLPHRMAIALHPSHDDGLLYEFTKINLHDEIPEALNNGELIVRNPVGRGKDKLPCKDSVILPHELRPFLEARGIGLRLMPQVSPAEALLISPAAVLPALRGLIAEDIQEHLHKSFSELPIALAERVEQAFRGLLMGTRDVALMWDESSHEQRNNAAIAADENAVLMLQYSRQAEEKRKAGRYNLEEIAKIFNKETNEHYTVMLAKLEKAAGNRTLPTYMLGRNAQNEYGSGPGRWESVSAYYDECFWDDINTWLAEYEPRISFRFQAPEPETQPAALPGAQAQAEPASEPAPVVGSAVNGITKTQIIMAFGAALIKGKGKESTLLSAMENGYVWAVRAREAKGTRGRGGSESIWCPVRMAIELHERKWATKAALNQAFFQYQFLSNWREQWREHSEGI
jgi:hypothetical protein